MMKLDKKILGIGICLMIVGLTMFFGGQLLPDNSMDQIMLQVLCMMIGIFCVFIIGFNLVLLSLIIKTEKNS